MKTPAKGALLRIFIGDADQWEGRALYEAIVLRARKQNMAGATVLRGVMGFGKNSRLHTAKLLELSTDMPVVIEIVDSEEKIRAFMPHVDEMVREGLITLENLTVIKYTANGRHD